MPTIIQMASDLIPAETLDGLKMIVPRQFSDDRGYFFEAYNREDFAELTGFSGEFVQDNQSWSRHGVLRGLHYQAHPRSQGKLLRVVSGAVFDVAVDIRRSSTSLGEWFAVELSAEKRNQLWIPSGFAHGFIVLSEAAEVLYKTTEAYSPEHKRTIRWDDPTIGIDWPMDEVGTPLVSEADAHAQSFVDAELLP